MKLKKAPRLAQCLEAGESSALLTLLHCWTKDDLLGLLKEIEDFAYAADEGIEQYWRSNALRPEMFLSTTNSAALDRMRDDAKMYILETLVEISAVAQLYLEQNYRVSIPIRNK